MERIYSIEEGEFSTLQIRDTRCELKIGSDAVRFDLETTGDRLVALLEAFLQDRRQIQMEWLDSEEVV